MADERRCGCTREGLGRSVGGTQNGAVNFFQDLWGALQMMDEAPRRIALKMRPPISTTRRCTITCERCHGLMVSEQIYDLQGMNSDLCVGGYCCLLCGNLVDATILENRRRSIDTAAVLTLMNPRMPRLVVA